MSGLLVLQTGQEQEQTFKKLIQAMGEQVEWTGRFIVRDDELILEGLVRSLVFQFETRQVFTNLYDLPIREDQVLNLAKYPALQNLINMVLYAFGKWGKLRGLRVEQDFAQLNQLFAKIMNAFYIEPSFGKENFRFYKVGVRITYEEVLETALAAEEKPQEEPAAEAQGLWHRLIWKKRERVFQKVETTLLQRQEDRIGNNFYLVGYLCPKCSQKLHMAVYPDGKELRIDTEEKGVYLARVYACSACNCFYTPRPQRLIAEGQIYEMSFDSDTRAFEDYLELLGRTAERTANFKYNEYEAMRSLRLNREQKREESGIYKEGQEDPDALQGPEDALRQIEDFSARFASLPDHVFRRFAHRVEEGFYPDAAVQRHEAEIQRQSKKRGIEEQGPQTALEAGPAYAGAMSGVNNEKQKGREENGERLYGRPDGFGKSKAAGGYQPQKKTAQAANSKEIRPAAQAADSKEIRFAEKLANGSKNIQAAQEDSSGGAQRAYAQSVGNADPGAERSGTQRKSGKDAQRQNAAVPVSGADTRSNGGNIEKYQARLGVLARLSNRQKSELKRQIRQDPSISDYDKPVLLQPIEEAEQKEKTAVIEKKIEKSRGRTYVQIQRVIEDLEKEELAPDSKQAYIESLKEMQRQSGAEEVRRILEKIPQRMDRAGYQNLEQKLQAYESVDLSPYAQTLAQKREEAEKQEIANMVKRSRKVSRGDYVGLMRRLEEQEFASDTLTPYMEKIEEKVRSMDEERLDELLDQVQTTDYNAAAAVYEQIEAENFLPELKSNALQMISRKLEKIRTEECELLVRKLQEEMEGTIRENPRHSFYPARKAMLKTAEPEETHIFDAALRAYAGERAMFEYPIFAVDTSRNGSGREGMLLTPETLFYSTRLSAYGIPVSSINSITASTGFLNHKLVLEEANGAEHKLPYAVKNSELEDWAGILDEFIAYLQEKPASRKLNYLAKETHDTICCFRCGYVYHGTDICPECGYKKNR